MTKSLLQVVESTTFADKEILHKKSQIHAAVLSQSKVIDAPNFTRIHTDDLKFLFHAYDDAFCSGKIKETLGNIPLDFGLSKRMTRSGGKTTRYIHERTGERKYGISVATSILFGCFDGENHRPIIASGIVCRDRLDALQRVMEHEIIHLIEMLLWEKSSCSQARFHSMSLRFFSHTENKHQLITPSEKAFVKFGVKPGMTVRFRFDGVEYQGFVNRITKRATVLVEDQRGQRYRDGKYYSKFYVPVEMLELVE